MSKILDRFNAAINAYQALNIMSTDEIQLRKGRRRVLNCFPLLKKRFHFGKYKGERLAHYDLFFTEQNQVALWIKTTKCGYFYRGKEIEVIFKKMNNIKD